MTYLETYLIRAERSMPGSSVSLKVSADDFVKKHLDGFHFNEQKSGLLFGHVQSGKTSQMFAVASAAADKGFKFFVLVTTDNVTLQGQTLERAKDFLGGFADGFSVLGELDDTEFLNSKAQSPTLLVLKKNVQVLRTWSNHIATHPYFKDKPLFVLDDEGDASSLNTKINQNEKSTIHDLLEKFRSNAPSSFFLHVTATPQSLLLQAKDSSWRPSFAHYIAPGAKYLGGNYFYGEENSPVRLTHDDEKDALLKQPEVIPEGLRKAVLSFLVAGAHSLLSKDREVCSLLIHPGVKKSEHKKTKDKVEQFLERVRTDLLANSATLTYALQDAWGDLQQTKPDISSIEDVTAYLKNGLPQINILVLNSDSIKSVKYDKGLNILIGGNSLGRGVTFPGLHTVYYCRSSKTPQADTCWQHARIFGYDRDAALCRIFTPAPLAKLFKELNEANNALFAVLREKGPDAVSILTPEGARPTRLNIVKRDELAILAGGVNYFPSEPMSLHLKKIDDAVGITDEDRPTTLEEILSILNLIKVEKSDPWSTHDFPSCIEALSKSGQKQECRLIIRTDRAITKGTGTLLSSNDRDLGKQYDDKLVLTLYRLEGGVGQGWEGKPLWVPNIKFAQGACFFLSTK